jgi:hypothetical protein
MQPMSDCVEVYFDEHGRVEGAWVQMLVNGQEVQLDFNGSQVVVMALYPEDANTVHDYPTPITHVVLPEKRRAEQQETLKKLADD